MIIATGGCAGLVKKPGRRSRWGPLDDTAMAAPLGARPAISQTRGVFLHGIRHRPAIENLFGRAGVSGRLPYAQRLRPAAEPDRHRHAVEERLLRPGPP